DVGYHNSMDYRFVRGAFRERGPATVWMRMGLPLLPDEEPTPLQRVLIAADSGNGVSVALDWTRYLFIHVDLSVHLHRMPEGEWGGGWRGGDAGRAAGDGDGGHGAFRRAGSDRASGADAAGCAAIAGGRQCVVDMERCVVDMERRGRDSNPRTGRTRSTAFKAAAINQTLPPLQNNE